MMKRLKFAVFGWLMVWVGCCGLVGVEGDGRWVRLGDHEAHPTQVMVRVGEGYRGGVEVGALLGELGLVVVREYELVPGLMCLDVGDGGVRASAAVGPGEGVVGGGFDLAGLIGVLEESGLFEYVEGNYVWRLDLEPTDLAYVDGRLWGLNNTGTAMDGSPFGVEGADVDVLDAWDITTGDRSVVVGVLDTGIRYTHVDLAGQIWVNEGEVAGNGLDDDGNGWVDDVHGANPIVGSGDPLDDEGHGTHVAGIIGASANDEGEMVGVAWELQLMGLKVLDSFGSGLTSDIAAGFEYGVLNGCHVINASLGGGVYSQASFDVYAAGLERGVLLVAAAGNSGLDTDVSPSYPASYALPNIISVAAMNRFDQLADFSNYGVNSVDIAAPGVGIYSTSFDSDDAYDQFDGTSQASPHVAGVAALVLARFPGIGVIELRERILDSAVLGPAYSGRLSTGGRVSAKNALGGVPDGALEVVVLPPSRSAVVGGEALVVRVRVSDLVGVSDAEVVGEGVRFVGEDGAVVDLEGLVFGNEGEAPDVMAGDAEYAVELMVPEGVGELVFRLAATAPEKEGVEVDVRYMVVARPGNDDFVDSFKLASEGGMVVTSTAFATIEEGEPEHGGVFGVDGSLWWTWTPSEDGVGFVDTSGSGFDTVIGVYEGFELVRLEEVVSVNDVGFERDGYLWFDARAGVGYRIAVAGAGEGEGGSLRLRVALGGGLDLVAPVVQIEAPVGGGSYVDRRVEVVGRAFDPGPNSSGVGEVSVRLNGEPIGRLADLVGGFGDWSVVVYLSPGENVIEARARDFSGNVSEADMVFVSYFEPEPVNDHFVDALVLEGVEGAVSGVSREGSKEFGEPLHAGNQGGASVWYVFEAPGDGVLDVSVLRNDFDTLLGMYVGERVTGLEEVASNDDVDGGGSGSGFRQAVVGGERYYLVVDGFDGESGEFGLRYEFVGGAVVRVDVVVEGGGRVSPGSGFYGVGSELVLEGVADEGFVFVGWEVGGSLVSSESVFVWEVVGDVSLVGVFGPRPVSDGFESGGFGLGYGFGGAAWDVVLAGGSGESGRGMYVARSGMVGDGGVSSLRLVEAFGGGVGSFEFRVDSEEGFDFFEFYVGGVLLGEWSGEVDWRGFEFSVPSGVVELEWRYVKDAFGSGGMDGVFLDNLVLPLGDGGGGVGLAPRLSWVLVEGGFELVVAGGVGVDYVVESSVDLVEWVVVREGRTDGDGVWRGVVVDFEDGGGVVFFRVRGG